MKKREAKKEIKKRAKEKIKEKFNKNFIVFVLAIVIAYLLVSTYVPVPKERQVLENLKGFPEVQPYLNYNVEIGQLTVADIAQLEKNQPAVYGNLTAGVWQVVYSSQIDGLLVIYDLDKNEIARAFHLVNVRLNTTTG